VRKETAQRRLHGDMEHNAWYWCRVQHNPSLRCLWRLWWIASTLTQLFCPDRNVLCRCYMCIWHDLIDQFFRQSAFLDAVSYDRVIFEEISTGHLKSAPGFLSDWSCVARKVPKTLTKHGIMWLELCCFTMGTLTFLSLAWNGILQMHSSDNVTLCRLPVSGIIQNKSWLLKSHMAHTWWVKFLNTLDWAFNLSTTP